MDTKTLRSLKHGTNVKYRLDGTIGYVVHYVVQMHRVKHREEDTYVQWSDGQRTYAFDNHAVHFIDEVSQ